MKIKRQNYLTLILLLFTSWLFGQRTVTGVVEDGETKDVMVGVSVMLKGSSKATITDLNGKYSITVPDGNAVLVFTFIGYRTQEVNVGANMSINISLQSQPTLGADLVVIGSRNLTRTKTETTAAVDVISVQMVQNQSGQLDINQILQYAAPSFNANRQSGSDGSDHIDPATLRGLGPDQTLVLINGKRQHPSALINIFGTRGRGNTGTDLNAIATSAIERVEIMRDGAAAQYGSDAIAGVVNIVLKNNVNSGSANLSYGAYNTGWGSSLKKGDVSSVIPATTDGAMMNANVNYGFGIGDKGGFINVTLDYLSKANTLRPNNETVFPGSNYRNQVGEAGYNQQSIYINSRLPLSNGGEVYAFGGYNYRKTSAYAWSRSADEVRNVKAIYPNGFDPKINSNVTDFSAAIGFKKLLGAWNFDISNTIGKNNFHYFGENTLNASLVERSPKSFDDGGFSLLQNTLNADLTRKYNDIMSGLNVAFGAEYRFEQFAIFAGEEASWKTYSAPPFLKPNGSGGFDTLSRPGGAQGFPGFQPTDVLKENRNVFGIYGDVELDITEKFLLAGAVRYENYSDFGSAFGGKLASRYKVSQTFTLRGSVQTGFRAPSLAQVYFRSTFSDVTAGTIVDKVIANNRSTLAQRVGIPTLKAENSVSGSLGFAFSPNNKFSISVDGYYVAVNDRIVLTGGFGSDDDKIGNILKAQNVSFAQFFTNALDTKTLGLDIVGAYNTALGGGKLNVTLAANFNRMSNGSIKTTDLLRGKEDNYFSERDKAFLLASAPNDKVNLAIDYKIKKFGTTLRVTRFAAIDILNWKAVPGLDSEADATKAANNMTKWRELVTDKYDARWVTDLNFYYTIFKNMNLTIGGTNIFDVYPTIHDSGWTETGGMWDAVQMGFGGAYFYGRLNYKF